MTIIILCAGYAVRLYPLTEKTPKPLLPIGRRPMLEFLFDKIRELENPTQIYLVTNSKFVGQFESWIKNAEPPFDRVNMINDRTTSNQDRLGALGDLNLVIKEARIHDDLLVLAGDNFFTFNLQEFVRCAQSHKSFASIGLYDVGDLKTARNYGLVETNGDGKITAFYEKPENPKTTLASTGIYYFPAEVLSLIDRYLAGKNNADAPGYFVQWLIRQTSVYGIPLNGIWYDIGDRTSYDLVNKMISQKSL